MNEKLLVWVVLAGNLWVIWLIVTAIRQVKVRRMRTEVQMKLIDRLTNNDQLAAFLASETGKEVLQSVTNETQASAQILGSLQWTVLLIFLGAGLIFTSGGMGSQTGAIGTICLLLGVGFGVAAGTSYVAAKKLGLLKSSGEK